MVRGTDSVEGETGAGSESDSLGGAGGILAALLASSCCWLPAAAALAGFSAAAVGVTMMQYHTPLALLALGLLGVSWYYFLRKRIVGVLPWNSGYANGMILTGSSIVVLLYTVIGWLYPSVFSYLTWR